MAGVVDPQRQCDQCKVAKATVYAIDPIPGGWGGWYCEPCTEKLHFQIVDRVQPTPRPDFDPRIDYPERYTDGPI